MYYTDDPVADFNRYDLEQARYEARLPHCDCCGEAIYEKYYEINDEIYCEECLEKLFGRDVEIDMD
jgi:formylmethanofuran dehydrogenase subunit E